MATATNGAGWRKDLTAANVVMGLQHTFVMFGATVLVPLLTGLDIGVTLLATGIGTLIFHLLTRMKVPIYLGSSFAFIPPIVAMAKSDSLAHALGGLAAAGVFFVLASLLFRFVSVQMLHKLFPAHVSGPMIVLIGLILAPIAVKNASGGFAPKVVAEIGVGGCWGVALLTFAVAVVVKLYFKRLGLAFAAMLPVIISLAVGYLVCLALGIVELSRIQQAAWVGLPTMTTPVFSWKAVTMFVPVALVAMVEHFGDVLAIGNVVGKDFFKDPGIHRTLLGDGVATACSACLGGPMLTTYSENTGAVALTGNSNPIIMRIAASFAILLAFVPKFTAFIASIPTPVIGGISILLFGMIASIGIKNMVDQRVDFTQPKVLILSAVMLVLGLGNAKLALGPVMLEGLGLAALVGVLLNLLLFAREIFAARR